MTIVARRQFFRSEQVELSEALCLALALRYEQCLFRERSRTRYRLCSPGGELLQAKGIKNLPDN
jgi:hypothetical protein